MAWTEEDGVYQGENQDQGFLHYENPDSIGEHQCDWERQMWGGQHLILHRL